METGIAIAVPPGYYYATEARSGLLAKGIVAMRGIIDGGYCGRLVIAMQNNTDEDYSIKAGDRIAQVILHKQYHGDLIAVNTFSFDYSTRGAGGTAGWGSSGT